MIEEKCIASRPQEPLNAIANELLEQLEKAWSKMDIVEDRLYGNLRSQCATEKESQPSGLQAKLEQALKKVTTIDERLEGFLSQM